MNTEGLNAPVVSIIIPVFNDGPGLRRCLRSIAKQSIALEDVEVIVIDNGSSPSITLEEQYGFQATLIRCTTPGSYAARNAGVRASTAPILAFTDADCTVEPSWALNGIASLRQHNEKVVVGGEVQFILPEEPTSTALYQTIVGFQQQENIERKGFSVTANLFCGRSVFEAAGPFDEHLLSGGDLEWCWRARKKGFLTIYAPDAIIHTHPRSTLRDAIRQARRVAGGRLRLADLGPASIPSDGLKPHRRMLASIWWILRHPNLRASERLRVLAIASLIRSSAIAERLRLRLGGGAERR